MVSRIVQSMWAGVFLVAGSLPALASHQIFVDADFSSPHTVGQAPLTGWLLPSDRPNNIFGAPRVVDGMAGLGQCVRMATNWGEYSNAGRDIVVFNILDGFFHNYFGIAYTISFELMHENSRFKVEPRADTGNGVPLVFVWADGVGEIRRSIGGSALGPSLANFDLNTPIRVLVEMSRVGPSVWTFSIDGVVVHTEAAFSPFFYWSQLKFDTGAFEPGEHVAAYIDNVLIWGDDSMGPISVESANWGRVKALYR